MPEATPESVHYRLQYAALGRQQPIQGDGTLAGYLDDTPLEGRTLEQGTHEFLLAVSGAARVLVDLEASAVAGSIAPEIGLTYRDRSVIGSSVAFTDLVADTPQTAELTDLCGEEFVRLTITIGAGDSVTFSRAEYRAL